MVWVIQRLSSQRSHSPVGVAQLWVVRRQRISVTNQKNNNRKKSTMKRFIITVLFLTLGAGLLIVGLNSGNAQPSEGSSKQVTFKTTENAPSDFNAWTFFWKAPSKDPDAKLEYIVMQPDGKEYFKLDVSRVKAGALIRSDFKPGFAGGDPSVFYNQHITITFRVSKGDLVFDPNGKYYFEFREERRVEAVMEVK
jgi:hypothetical protein